MFGSEKFQSIINDWFRIIQMSELKFSRELTNTSSTQLDSYLKGLEIRNSNPSLLTILEQYIIQYNIIPIDNVSIRHVVRSWIIANNDIIVNINRDYNNKKALVKVESLENQKLINLM